MPQLRDVHETEMDRATGRMVVTRVNPTRDYLQAAERGTVVYRWQNGHWFDPHSKALLRDEDVPLEFRQSVLDNPVKVPNHGPVVTKVCQVCNEELNASEMDDHLLGHVQSLLGDTKSEEPRGKR